MKFKTDLITYEGIYRTIETEKLNLPTSEGRRTILANHMPLMMPLQVGVIETMENGELKHYAINGGVLYFKDNIAEIVADSILDVAEIDIDAALKEKAKEEEKENKKPGFFSKIWKAIVTAITATIATILGNKISNTITGKKERKSSTSTTGKIVKNATTAATRTITRDILGNLVK